MTTVSRVEAIPVSYPEPNDFDATRHLCLVRLTDSDGRVGWGEAVTMFESAVYARYEVSGPGAAAWLDHLLAAKLPSVGRVRLAPMLNPSDNLMGDLTVSRLGEDRFWLVGSYYLQAWHMRWFADHLPAQGVTIQNLSDNWMGFAISGPKSRTLIRTQGR